MSISLNHHSNSFFGPFGGVFFSGPVVEPEKSSSPVVNPGIFLDLLKIISPSMGNLLKPTIGEPTMVKSYYFLWSPD